jgi:tRNA 2-selenouridine synthase
MPITKLSIPEFVHQSANHSIFDVRSPCEYAQAHIPGAYSLPLFNDEERKTVGTAYKQQSREHAIKLGLDFFGPKMRQMVEEVESIHKKYSGNKPLTTQPIFIHCWRGGMRSGAVSWLLNLYGFDVFLLDGGYKAYRNWVLEQFEKSYDIKIVGGYTGSGKTPIMQQLQKNGERIIDLEALANHKGSAFGAFGQPPQPRQEMFENLLAMALYNFSSMEDTNPLDGNKAIWLEDESQRIGVLNIPLAFWKMMRTMPLYFVDIPFEERLGYITQEYGVHEKEKLLHAIIRIQKRLGPLETKTAIGFLLEDNFLECFRILLSYYDKYYGKALYNRENINALLNKIECSSVDTLINTQKILTCEPVHI